MENEIRPLLSPQRDNNATSNHHSQRYYDICCKVRQSCIQYRAVILILIWTVLVSELQTLLYMLISSFIENYVPIDRKDTLPNAVSSPIAFLYAILAVVAMLYPLSGFIADVYCGRFKTVLVGLTFIFVFSASIVVLLLGWISVKHSKLLFALEPIKKLAPFYVVGFGSAVFLVLGLAAFQANFFQLGLDQLLDAPSTNLSIFIHLASWAEFLGTVIMTVSGSVVSCSTANLKYRIVFCVVPVLSQLCFPVLLIFSCCKHHWFYSEISRQNPYKNVLNVLNFVRKHDIPLQRSAFTYDGDETPSRMDFAKGKYGGPFTTEQVEDVKTFLRILLLLSGIGSVFILEITNSYIGFKVFGQHTGYIEDFIGRCSIWIILESGALGQVISVTVLPIYMCKYLRKSIFCRMISGFILCLIATLSMLLIDLSGHFHHVNDQGTGSHCMFTYSRRNNASSLKYPILEMPWSVLILPNILLGIGRPILLSSIFEFISAQSPHSMKGLLIGVLYAIKGVYQLTSSIALIPISSDRFWSKGRMREHPPVTNCGFIYFLFTLFVALVGLIVSAIVAKQYKYRERDDRPYNQSIVEEIFDCRNRMRSPTPDYYYDDIDA